MTAPVLDTTGEVLLATWLEQHDDETPDEHAAALLLPVPFDFTPTLSEED